MSKPNRFTLTIDNFDNAAMSDDPDGAVAQILEEVVRTIESGRGLLNLDGSGLRDINGNRVGHILIGASK